MGHIERIWSTILVSQTDSRNGKKPVYLTERLVQAWVDYEKNVRPLPATPKDDEFLILGEYGQFRGKRLETTTTITRMIKEISMYAQIKIPDGEKPTNYLIKRTSITRQLKQCRDPKIIQLQAGHSKLSTTMKYNRINENDIRNYLRTFEDKSMLTNEKREYAKTKSINH
jgi:integrase